MREAASTSLRAILQELLGDDTYAAAVGTMEGALVDIVVKRGQTDLGSLAGDLATLLKVGAYCTRKLEGGEMDSVTVATDRITLVAIALTLSHYLAIILPAGGNVARARLSIKKHRNDLVELLR